MSERKELGRIASVTVGIGGYQGAMLGVGFVLEGKGWGVHTPFVGTWQTWSDGCKWTREDQSNAFAEAMRHLGDTLKKARKTEARQLVGIPVEATFESNMLKSWRVLEEVL